MPQIGVIAGPEYLPTISPSSDVPRLGANLAPFQIAWLVDLPTRLDHSPPLACCRVGLTSAEVRERYESAYANSGEALRRWRELGAVVKVDHISQLIPLARAPKTVIEVGCGDGAVMAELCRRGIGHKLVGVDISSAAIRLALSRPEVTEARVFDGLRIDEPDNGYDLAICSHVLEHVEEPLALLEEITRVAADAIVIEVPLESNLSARRARARVLSENAGHVQRFDRRGLRRLIAATGWQVRGELLDPLPSPVHIFDANSPLAVAKGYAKWAVRSTLAFRPRVAERLITLHYAVLATPPA